MTEILALSPAGTYVRMTIIINPAIFQYLDRKGFTVVQSVPVK